MAFSIFVKGQNYMEVLSFVLYFVVVLGIGVKLFSVAGPVILFGTLSSVVYGIYYYVMKLMGV